LAASLHAGLRTISSADQDLLRPLGVVRALEKSSDGGPLLRAIEEEDSG
jgi:hypothetical protein